MWNQSGLKNDGCWSPCSMGNCRVSESHHGHAHSLNPHITHSLVFAYRPPQSTQSFNQISCPDRVSKLFVSISKSQSIHIVRVTDAVLRHQHRQLHQRPQLVPVYRPLVPVFQLFRHPTQVTIPSTCCLTPRRLWVDWIGSYVLCSVCTISSPTTQTIYHFARMKSYIS